MERVVAQGEEESRELMATWMDIHNPPVKVIQPIDLMGIEPPESYFQIVINPFPKSIS